MFPKWSSGGLVEYLKRAPLPFNNEFVKYSSYCVPVKYEIHKLMITSSKLPWSCIKCQTVISFLRMQEGPNVITARSVLAGGLATL